MQALRELLDKTAAYYVKKVDEGKQMSEVIEAVKALSEAELRYQLALNESDEIMADEGQFIAELAMQVERIINLPKPATATTKLICECDDGEKPQG